MCGSVLPGAAGISGQQKWTTVVGRQNTFAWPFEPCGEAGDESDDVVDVLSRAATASALARSSADRTSTRPRGKRREAAGGDWVTVVVVMDPRLPQGG